MIEHQPHETCQLAFGQRMSREFTARVMHIAHEFGWHRNRINYFVTCMALSSGYNFAKPAFLIKDTDQELDSGLICFTEEEAVRYGTTLKAMVKMTNIEQLNYVYHRLRPNHQHIDTLADMYIAFAFKRYPIKHPIDVLTYQPGDLRRIANLPPNLSGIITKNEAASQAMQWLIKGLHPQHVGAFPE